jgi:hypothetical protein
VEIQQERIAFINDKVVNKVEDENFGEAPEIDSDDEEDEVSLNVVLTVVCAILLDSFDVGLTSFMCYLG